MGMKYAGFADQELSCPAQAGHDSFDEARDNVRQRDCWIARLRGRGHLEMESLVPVSGEVPMNLLSIQSHVVYGHVGNSAAVFPLQRMGVEVWPLHTVQFSNHTGYGSVKGQVFDAAMIREVVSGIEQIAMSRRM